MTKAKKRLQAECDEWNKLHPVGSEVTVTLDDGIKTKGLVRWEANLLSGHTPVAWIEGISGCYLLERCK